MGTQISKGGVAPMDIWKGGEDWDDGLLKEVEAAMANGGLRVGQIHERYGHETPRPTPKPPKKLAKPFVPAVCSHRIAVILACTALTICRRSVKRPPR